MLEVTIGMSLIVGVLFLFLALTYIFKWEKIRLYMGLLMSCMAILSMILFCYASWISGNPDQGMELLQFYFPILVYGFFMVFGAVPYIKARKQ